MRHRHTIDSDLPKLFGIIAVAYRGDRTFYVRRSLKMTNYPGVWSLPSIQFGPGELPNVEDLPRVQTWIDRISVERFGGAPLVVKRFLTSGDSTNNPINRHVFLNLYEVDMLWAPRLNPDYYTDCAWMTAAEYEYASAGQSCGLCLRLWSDYAWLKGITDRPFIARASSAYAN